MRQTTYINLFAGPGAGKSTTAAGVFSNLKQAGILIELVTEYAKDMTWEKRFNVLGDQLYMMAKQNRRLERLNGEVDYVITDGPLLIGAAYLSGADTVLDDTVQIQLFHLHRSRNNLDVFIKRTKPYVQVGRNQTETEAWEKDQVILSLLQEVNHGDNFLVVNSDNAIQKLTQQILQMEARKNG